MSEQAVSILERMVAPAFKARLLVNACYWCLGMEDQIPAKSDVELVGKYEPNDIGMKGYKPGLKPSDHKL